MGMAEGLEFRLQAGLCSRWCPRRVNAELQTGAAPPYRIMNMGNKKAPDCSGALMKTN